MTMPADPSQGLDQQAIDSALDTYNQAATQYSNAAAQFDQIRNDPNASQGDITAASQRLDNSRSQLGSASRAYSTILAQVASQRNANARAAKDPNQQRLWTNEADRAQAQSDLYNAEASMYTAKTQADIDKANADATAALQRANAVAGRVQSQNDASQAQALLASARAAQIPALTQSTIQLHQAAIQADAARAAYLQSRVAVSGSQVDVNEARAQLISGPQATALLSKAELDAARAKGLDLTQGATLDKIQAAANLSDARVKQIAANISKSQVLPYTDRTSPNLTIFQPSTGNVTGVPNPGYVNTTLQGINDTEQAIQAIQQQIASGQMSAQDGTQLIDNMRQALNYKALGVTPDQYLQAQNQQAQLGMGVLNNYMGTLEKGQTAADQFLSAARGIRNLPAGVNFTPFSTFGQIANQVYGPSLAHAQALINQVQPVSDRFSALQAFGQLSAAKQALQQHAQQSGQPATGGTDQVNQATNAGMTAVQNATDAAGGNPNMPTAATAAGILPQQLQGVGM